MQIKRRAAEPILIILTMLLGMSQARAGGGAPELDRLVNGFPTLDELESRLGEPSSRAGLEPGPSPQVDAASQTAEGAVYPVSARWFTAPPAADPFSGAPTGKSDADNKPLAATLASMDAAQKEAGDLGKAISREANLPINKYFLDRWTAYARTQYGTDITGLFVGGVGIGTFQQSLLQTYGIDYNLPLLQRYAKSTKWTRVLSGWTIGSSVGAMPQFNSAFQIRQLLNNLQLSWSVSLSYNIAGSTLRKIQDGQYDKEADLGKAAGRAAAAREDLLKKMALRIDTLSANRPVRDTRLNSLRELYPQFELYQARYDQASSCDEQMEDFFTLKGLALSLLTVAGYDQANPPQASLLQAWKRARFTACGRT